MNGRPRRHRAQYHRAVRARRARRGRGFTILEAMLATVLLGMVGATLAGAVSYMSLTQRRGEQRLAAAELGNRLMLQYLDNQDAMPSDALPIEYNGDQFRWTMEVQRVEFDMVEVPDEDGGTSVGTGFSFQRVRLVRVSVWLAESAGGSRGLVSGIPSATLTRLVDPLNFSNPDSLRTIIEEPGGIERLFERFSQLGEGGSP